MTGDSLRRLQEVGDLRGDASGGIPPDIEEVCNYVDALNYAAKELRRSKGLPICTRLLCAAHKRLMKGERGKGKRPGDIRQSQNWVGGNRPGNAVFVPPPPGAVTECLSQLERWIHAERKLPPLVRVGLAHAQFETIHPFLDGNGRIGRLLITLLLKEWELLPSPLLYLSLAFRRRQAEYYRRLSGIRTDGDWEGWLSFFLSRVAEAANDGVAAAKRIFALVGKDREQVVQNKVATIPAVRLFDLLPSHPVVTLPRAVELLDTTKPTASKAINVLVQAGVLTEITGKRRDRVYAYGRYLGVLAEDTGN